MATKRSVFPEHERNQIVELAKKTLRTSEGLKALQYLKDMRGFDDETIDKFNVGYCPERVNHELNNRIITPIYDAYGKLVALSSRHLQNTKNFFHESFEKGFHLYGLNFAKPDIVKSQKAIVVEGEFDVLYLHARNIRMVVGLCGSAITIFQLALLSRYCSEIFIVFDGDDKRDQSVKRVMKLYNDNCIFRESGIKVFPVNLPQGYDPDDFIKKQGREEFSNLLKKARKD